MSARDETVAQVYANALLDLAFQKGVHAEVLAELRSLQRLLGHEKELATFVYAPHIRQRVKKELIERVFGGRVSDATLHFLLIVVDKRRQQHLPRMIEAYEDGYHLRMGELIVETVTAVPLDGGRRARLKGVLQKKFDKEIILQERVDARLLGGLVLRVGDSRIDGSLRARLETIGARLEATRIRSEDTYED